MNSLKLAAKLYLQNLNILNAQEQLTNPKTITILEHFNFACSGNRTT